MELYKILRPDGRTYHGGTGSWPLPHGDEPGEWIEAKGKLVACRNGLHLCQPDDLLGWIGPAIFVAELDENAEFFVHEDGDHSKIVARRARLLRPTAWTPERMVTFAADCAERVLPLFEAKFPNDKRPRQAIEAARARADAAHDAAAYDAAAYAAYAAARAAAYADAYARAAAYDAARAAAYAAAHDAYAAAYDARAAAYADAYAAAYDARAAAYAAAYADAYAAAAERQWQRQRLMELVVA